VGALANEAGYIAGARDRVTVGVGVMARAPSADGKTRLAAHLPADRLLSLRKALLTDTLNIVESAPGASAVVFFTPADAKDEIRALSGDRLTCVAQRGHDLGERMLAAIEHLLTAGQFETAILVGTDMPLLTAGHITEACEALDASRGVVLGPADDGGYYLIGMRTMHPQLFQGIEWGSPSVLTDTLRAADRAGIEPRLIRRGYDVDTIDDLRRLESDLRTASPNVARQVRAWFKSG